MLPRVRYEKRRIEVDWVLAQLERFTLGERDTYLRALVAVLPQSVTKALLVLQEQFVGSDEQFREEQNHVLRTAVNLTRTPVGREVRRRENLVEVLEYIEIDMPVFE